MKLRPYQATAIERLSERFAAGHKRIVAVAPTGSGKTVFAAAFIRRRKEARVLWVAHRIELLRQAYDHLRAAGIPKRELGILSGPDKINVRARVLVASIGMFRSRTVPPADLIVVDEAHRVLADSYQDVIYSHPEALTLGLTATPWRLDGQALGETFDELLSIAGPTELIAQGWIAAPVVYGVPEDKARALVAGIATHNGDYASGALAQAMMKRVLLGDIVSECARLAPTERTIVFAVNRDHARQLTHRFKRAGRVTAYLDALTPNGERSAMLTALENGDTEVIVNVDVLSEGFDCPPVNCIVLARPTRSRTRFLQQVGRASRPYGAKRPIVLDHAGNTWRFGLPDREWDWSLDGRAKLGSNGDGPVRCCEACGAMIPLKARECPCCGADQAPTEQELSERDAEFERLRHAEREMKHKRAILEKLASTRGLSKLWIEQALQEIA